MDIEHDMYTLQSYAGISVDWYPMLFEDWYWHEIKQNNNVCVKDRPTDRDCVFNYNRKE
jgi:hypothetical protein